MHKEINGQCRENNEKLSKVKACRQINLHYENSFLVPMYTLYQVSIAKFSFGIPPYTASAL